MTEVHRGATQTEQVACAAAQLDYISRQHGTDVTTADEAARETPVLKDCNVCKDVVSATRSGGVIATKCMVSKSCEGIWASMHPEAYETKIPEDGVLPCAGSTCHAILRLTGEIIPPELQGSCLVDEAGQRYLGEYARLLNNMPLTDPDAGIPAFDGQQ